MALQSSKIGYFGSMVNQKLQKVQESKTAQVLARKQKVIGQQPTSQTGGKSFRGSVNPFESQSVNPFERSPDSPRPFEPPGRDERRYNVVEERQSLFLNNQSEKKKRSIWD
jgi:hypothetical protein